MCVRKTKKVKDLPTIVVIVGENGYSNDDEQTDSYLHFGGLSVTD